MMGMFCEEHFNNLTKTKELLNFPICWMHYKLEREPSIINWRERCLDLMFIIKLQSRMLKRSIVCFELESRVWDSLLEDIRSSCEERGSMMSVLSTADNIIHISGSFNNLKSKLHLTLIYLFINFTAKNNLLFIFYSEHSEQTNIQKIKVPQL